MMETTTHNSNLTLDSTINQGKKSTEQKKKNFIGYLKSANKYLTSNIPSSQDTTRPRVIQWDPHMGTDQSTLSVVLEQVVSETNEEIKPMKLVFGQLVVETNQQQQRAPTASPISSTTNANLIWITLVAHVPRFSDTQVESNHHVNQQVPLSICVYDSNNTDTATDHWNFGVFTYKKGAAEVKQEHHQQNSKKRSAEEDSTLNEFACSKRVNTSTSTLEDDQLFNQLLAPFDDSPGKSTPRSQPLLAPQPSSNPTSILSQITSTQPTTTYQPPPPTSSAGVYYGFNDYHVNIQPSPNYPPPPPANYNSYQGYGANYNMSSTNPMYANYVPLHQQHQQRQAMVNSQQRQQHQHQQQQHMVSTNGHPFAGVLSKANLKITGDLMEMTYTWTQEEWTNGRRLVEFWKRQGGDDDDAVKNSSEDETISEVECGFKPIEQEVYQQQRIRENLAAQKDAGAKKKSSPLVVSCIYWQERNDYFITSVDCIYLLEGLIGVQFTVEEKNRIRRNLEGFRPLTVSKCKPECADFFKLIMSFPHPKPRNIEKDVKVFSWKTLPNALRKIIRKYTPSYSSTAVVNLNN
ncbi:hypothetical protein HPULCUR_000681 [Helicostylum pulchrum]|uniref:DUF7082 domain-containing protein n=1 Tax=Helicostylum pulchrum TaxID=562976 RepID=A0ABP9XLT3_9FUNG